MKAGTVLLIPFLLFAPWTGIGGKGTPTPLPDHAIYIGVIQVLHEEEAATATVNVKVFTDDMQNALRDAFDDYKVIPLGDICTQQKDLLAHYFADHLSFTVNGKAVAMDLRSCSIENDVYWLTFDMACPSKWDKLNLKADFFMELFPTQSNMVSLHHGEERRFLRLTKGAAEQSVVF